EVELISDEPAWWQSLLRNLADMVAPERLPALRLTSPAVNPEMASNVLVTPRWSAVIAGPTPSSKTQLRDPRGMRAPADTPVRVARAMRTELIHLSSLEVDPDTPLADEFESKVVRQLKRSIHRSRIRQIVWISVAAAEVVVLVLFIAR